MTNRKPAAPKIMKLINWPEIDRHAWEIAVLDSGDPFDGVGPAARWRAPSRKHAFDGYGRWLQFLATGAADDLLLAPPARVTPQNVSRFMEFLRMDGVRFPLNYIKGLYDAIRVMAPNHDWHWLREVMNALERHGKQQHRGRQLPGLQQLIDLGLQLMSSATLDTPHHAGAIQYRDGLLILLLALRPIRRGNLTDLTIGKNLLRVGGSWVLLFAGSETKTHAALEYPLPALLVPWLETYLQDVRPRFPGAALHDGLWASTRGRPLSSSELYRRICNRTESAFGYMVTPHQFRSAAATTIAIEDPANVHAAKDLLGHASFGTTYRHYIQARSVEAAQLQQEAIARLRQLPVLVSTSTARGG
jgi:integrase/recombinase XerD